MASRRARQVGAFLYFFFTVGFAVATLQSRMGAPAWGEGASRLLTGTALVASAVLALFIAVGATRFLHQQRARAFKTGLLVSVTAAATFALLERAAPPMPEELSEPPAMAQGEASDAADADAQASPSLVDGSLVGLVGVSRPGVDVRPPQIGH